MMSVLSWLKRSAVAEDKAGNATAKPGDEFFHGGNMKNAIDAHVAWKDRLAAQINGASSETLEISVVACDDHCLLGQWIHSEGKKSFSHLPEFVELRSHHAQFHLNAGNVLREAYSNRKEAADKILNGSEFRQASDMVQLGLVRLYDKSQSL
jgi:hypothetical protein